MTRIALIVGIDDYPGNPLTGCVADAQEVAKLLGENDDNSPNFSCRVITSAITTVRRVGLRKGIEKLFASHDADVAALFFAGHGSRGTTGGMLVTQDAADGDEGIPMAEVVGLANRSKAKERVIILDCCHAGAIDELSVAIGNVPLSEGVSILAACRPHEGAVERNGRGLFTGHICDALKGGAADIRGNVTIAGAYAYVIEVLTGWDQRPLFRSSLSQVTTLRRAKPSITDATLRRLTDYFPQADYIFPLDPSYEPSAEPADTEHERIFSDLQRCRAARLVEPLGTDHMYFAAVDSMACRLTPLGQFYWRAVKAKKI